MSPEKNQWRQGGMLFSLRNALNGIIHIISHHRNARIIFICGVVVICAGFCFKISRLEMFILGFTMMLVFITEVINTVIEDITNFISEDFHYKIKIIKDVAAGVVLASVLFSLFVGYFIFGERILKLVVGR